MNASATKQSFTENTIEVRKFNPDLEGVERYYVANDPFKTHFTNAMSITFPEGERYFLRSVLAYKDEITDPKLQEEIKQFCAQEAQHSLVHVKLNETAKRFGYPMDKIESVIAKILRWRTEAAKTSRFWKRYNLAATTCLEHFTAILAKQALTRPDIMFGGMDPRIRSLYQWHAVEEIEHRAVSYDVYKATGGNWLFLRVVMLIISFLFMFTSLRITWVLLRQDGEAFRWKTLKSAIGYLFVPPQAVLFRVLPDWLTFFVPGFHPSKHHGDLDTEGTLAKMEQYLQPAVTA